jgi:hypothetical protein
VGSILFESFQPVKRQHPKRGDYLVKLVIDAREIGSISVDGVRPEAIRVSYLHVWSQTAGDAPLLPIAGGQGGRHP